MILLSAHRDELEVQHDDDKWSHHQSTRSRSGLHRPLLFLQDEAHPSFFEVDAASELNLEFHDLSQAIFAVPSAIGDWKKFHSRFRRYYFLCFEASSVDFWRTQFFTLHQTSAITISTFQIPPRPLWLREILDQTFLPHWWSHDWSFWRYWIIINHRSERNDWSF